MKFCWLHLLCHNGEWNNQRMNLLPSDAPFNLCGVLVKHSCVSGFNVALPSWMRIKCFGCHLSCGTRSSLRAGGEGGKHSTLCSHQIFKSQSSLALPALSHATFSSIYLFVSPYPPQAYAVHCCQVMKTIRNAVQGTM